MNMEKVSLVIEIGKLAWDPIKRHGSYLFYYRQNVNTFITKANRLEQRQIEVQQDVNQACQRGEVICDRAQQWLTSVENMKFEAKRMEANSANTECLRNPFLCYRLGKEAAEKISHVDQLENEANSKRVAYLPPNPNAESLLPNRGFQASAPTEAAMKLILDALKDDEINIIGVHGMGGVGKTMLTREVAKQAERDKLFDRVVMVTVSQNATIEKIQKEIGEMVCFRFEDDSISVRAAKLLARLKREKKLLVILDDLWEKLELSDVGIPYGDEHKGCKIIITSRSSDLYMIESQGSQTKRRKIDVKPWPEKESWNLFEKKAGDVVNSNELSEIAMNIVKECKGLPLAIVVLGLALHDKSDPGVWNAVLHRLKNAIPAGIKGMEKEVFQSIKYSYDHLGSDEQLCFLFCCLFPEDKEISRYYITWYMAGEGLIEFTETLDEVNNQVSLLFYNLKASGLLLECDGERLVKMHDIVGDVAIWIASKQYGFYSRPRAALKEWPRNIKAEYCQRISLQFNEITKLPHEQLSFPNLRTLLLNRNWNLEMIPEGFFSEMKALKVLDLSCTRIKSLSRSLSSLTNLRVLLLGECGLLEDLSGIGALKNLEVLDLNEDDITVLPTELGELSNLRSLCLTNTRCTIPSGVISRLTRLEQLYTFGGFKEWQPQESNDTSRARFAELAHLSCLRKLDVYIEDERCFQQDLGHGCFQELKRFEIFHLDINSYYESDAKVTIMASVVPDWAKLLVGRADQLILYRCPGVEFLDGGLDISITAFSNIKHLRLIEMNDLCRLCHMAPPDGFLANLKNLTVKGCDKLTNILSSDLISRAHQLEHLSVFRCNQLSHMFHYNSALGGESHDPTLLPHVRTLDLYSLPQLTSIWEGGAPLQSLGNLQHLSTEECGSLEHVFTWRQVRSLALLETLSIKDCPHMAAIIISDEANSEVQVTENNSNVLPRLTVLSLHGLEIASFDEEGVVLFDWPFLEDVTIDCCPNLKKLPLSSQGAPRLCRISGSEEWFQALEWEDENIKSRLRSLFSSD